MRSYVFDDFVFECVQHGRKDVLRWAIEKVPHLKFSKSAFFRLALRNWSDIFDILHKNNVLINYESSLRGARRTEAKRVLAFLSRLNSPLEYTLKSPLTNKNMKIILSKYEEIDSIPDYDWFALVDSSYKPTLATVDPIALPPPLTPESSIVSFFENLNRIDTSSSDLKKSSDQFDLNLFLVEAIEAMAEERVPWLLKREFCAVSGETILALLRICMRDGNY